MFALSIQPVPPLENVVRMEDVFGQGKDVMELTTVATILTKPTAVCFCLNIIGD